MAESKTQAKTKKPRRASKPRTQAKKGTTAAPNTGKDPKTGQFTTGNQFWKVRSTHGRNPIFPNPEVLLDACIQYFEWVDANPLYEARLVSYMGDSTIEQVPKMRPMTLSGLQIFIDISDEGWNLYRHRPEFVGVCSTVEKIIRDQKFSGAAAGFFNPLIIARDLGLSDKTEITGKNGGPLETKELSTTDLVRRMAFLFRRAEHEMDKQGGKDDKGEEG